jgi:hypothetical protein
MSSCNGPISVPSNADPMEQRRSGLNWTVSRVKGLGPTIAVEGGEAVANPRSDSADDRRSSGT